ncbi:hypothetical protein BCR36DRAFT_89924 [Piromyces finnis]|uniref:CNH domain-containing protein n=1 Tax=Piromyces finnis TaxID=1754191 RepID=A0A1Y1VLE1_9FUNG|nr:hypothetical protein BCR36DRAFT_89924 [Piromyces finnis]|eukprot:ORX59242.1 hypothetical protein BCR36DRAFT_89924 [Piromyces finnis]
MAVIEPNANDYGFNEDGNPQNRLVNPIVIGPGFKMEILTSDFFAHYLLFGTEKALYYIDTSLPREQQIPVELIINTRFKQIKILEDYGVMMALSGKNNHIRQYNLSSIKKLIKHSTGMSAQMIMNAGRNNNDEDEVYKLKSEEKIDDETTILGKWVNDYTKILATKDALSFVIERTATSVHMSVLFRQDIILFEWAKDPYLRFMKVKAFWLPETPKVMSVLHDGIVVSEIYLGYTNEANIVSVNDSHVTELPVSQDFIRAQPSNPGNSDRPRWQQFVQVPFNAEQKKTLQGTIRPMGTINKKLMAAVGPTINRQKKPATDMRSFLATFGAVSRVVDVMGRPISTLQFGFGNVNGDFGSGYGIRWVDGPPKETVILENKFVLSIGQNSVEVAVWKTGEVVQVLRHVNSIKLLQKTDTGVYLYVGKKKKGGFIYKLEETAQAKALSAQNVPQQNQQKPVPPPSRNYNQPPAQIPPRQIPARQVSNQPRPRPGPPAQQQRVSSQQNMRSPRSSATQYSNRPRPPPPGDYNNYNHPPSQNYQRPPPPNQGRSQNRPPSTPQIRNQEYYGTGGSSGSGTNSFYQTPPSGNFNMRNSAYDSYDRHERTDSLNRHEPYDNRDRRDNRDRNRERSRERRDDRDYYDSRERRSPQSQQHFHQPPASPNVRPGGGYYNSPTRNYPPRPESRQPRPPSHQQRPPPPHQQQYQQMQNQFQHMNMH